MNIIARAALYLYDGSQAAPIFPDKVGKPGRSEATACRCCPPWRIS